MQNSAPPTPGAPAALPSTAPIAVGAQDVPVLVAAVFEAAPLPERKRLLELMIRPLGLLSLASVANGIFGKIALRSNWTRFKLQADDVKSVKPGDVMALALYVQQMSTPAFDGMRSLLMNSPALMSSTAAVLLLALLTQEYKRRNAAALEKDFDPPL